MAAGAGADLGVADGAGRHVRFNEEGVAAGAGVLADGVEADDAALEVVATDELVVGRDGALAVPARAVLGADADLAATAASGLAEDDGGRLHTKDAERFGELGHGWMENEASLAARRSPALDAWLGRTARPSSS